MSFLISWRWTFGILKILVSKFRKLKISEFLNLIFCLAKEYLSTTNNSVPSAASGCLISFEMGHVPNSAAQRKKDITWHFRKLTALSVWKNLNLHWKICFISYTRYGLAKSYNSKYELHSMFDFVTYSHVKFNIQSR